MLKYHFLLRHSDNKEALEKSSRTVKVIDTEKKNQTIDKQKQSSCEIVHYIFHKIRI